MTIEHKLAGAYAGAQLSPLEMAALEWLDGFYQLEHLLATRAWALTLAPDASRAVRFAALVHDAERFFPGGPHGVNLPLGPADPKYLIDHSARSAQIVDDWLAGRPEGVDQAFRDQVRTLILRHEFGGDPDEDLLQAADSLAFLSTFDWLVVEWVLSGRSTLRQAQCKLDWMLCRIRVQKALTLALPDYRSASQLLASPETYPSDLAARRVMAGDLALLLGRKTNGAAARDED